MLHNEFISEVLSVFDAASGCPGGGHGGVSSCWSCWFGEMVHSGELIW